MNFFIAVHYTYQYVEIALFEDQKCHAVIREDKLQVSKQFLNHMQTLLQKAQIELSDLTCIGVNQGPGPFTTLRTVLAFVNGIGFSRKVPLIGVSGIDAFLDEYKDRYPYILALLNAFHHDVYVGIHTPMRRLVSCMSIHDLQQLLRTQYERQSFLGIGSGIESYRSMLDEVGTLTYADPMPAHVSIEQIGKIIYQKMQDSTCFVTQVVPMYLKEQQFATVRNS